MLSRREYCRKELRQKLMAGMQLPADADQVDVALDRLEDAGYLSDARYATSRIRARQGLYGNRRLEGELLMSGVSRAVVHKALQEADDEFVRARAVWTKRFGKLPEDSREKAKQIRFLASRGFSFDVISSVLAWDEFEEDFESNF